MVGGLLKHKIPTYGNIDGVRTWLVEVVRDFWGDPRQGRGLPHAAGR
jgi:hypothetical protein